MTNLPHGYTNQTRLKDKIVTKKYSGADAEKRFLTELALYEQLYQMSFMPELVRYDNDELTICTIYIEGRHGQDLIAERCDKTAFATGQLARKIQQVSIDTLAEQKRSASQVLVHGDFGPQNILFRPNSFADPYLLDWEWSHFGDEFEDVAWAEWIIRMHYDANPKMIEALYDGFGDSGFGDSGFGDSGFGDSGFGVIPSWKTRHQLMLDQCKRILEFAKRDNNEQSITTWFARIEQTKSFKEIPLQ